MKALWQGSFLLLVFLWPASASSQSRALPQTPQVALSALSDGLGWKQPRYYSTIQVSDLDGDGQSELLARWIDGLNIYRFENGTLVRHSQIAALSDNAGFYEPSWYSTIRAGVLEPKLGLADIIAREGDGIHVFRYNRDKHIWNELGANATVRPFANNDAGGTDWTQPQYYSTIQLADVTGDGSAELVGRGRGGMQVWRWSAAQGWNQILAGGTLTDDEGFNKEPYYTSIQLADIDRDGAAELIARAPAGVRTYKWSKSGWVNISSYGPFRDDPNFLSSKQYKSVHTIVDASGQAWLYGLTSGFFGPDDGAIQVHRWNQNRWQVVQTIPLPGTGWSRESQSTTLTAADIQGNTDPEFLARGPGGLYAFDVKGRSLPTHTQSFTDAQGWNLVEQASTLKTAKASLTENGANRNRTLVLARGGNGLEVYKFTTQWITAADPNFPQYCSNFKTDNSVACISYKFLSNACVDGTVDIRSLYTQNTNTQNTFNDYRNDVLGAKNPFSGASAPIFENVRTQLVNEMSYGYTIEGWFANNNAVLKDNYDAAGTLLTQAQTDVDLSTSTSVVTKWLEFAGDIVSEIAGAIPGEGQGISIIIAILDDTYKATSSSGGDVTQEVAAIATALNQQRSAYITASANEKTAYLTSYSKMTQIGLEAKNGGYDWANASVNAVADAKTAGEHGMLINFYRTLLPAKWNVYWCTGNDWEGGFPQCSSIYTQTKYNCTYGLQPGTNAFPLENAYIYATSTTDVNWSLLDRLTGPTSASKDNLDAIWYMMLLGGDLGWDLPQTRFEQYTNQNTPDPNLAFSQIEHGYTSKSANCSGNGSFHGIVNTSQTLGARLSVAQQNPEHITSADAKEILQDIRALKRQAELVSQDRETVLSLTSPLREAANLIEIATDGRRRRDAQVSATTPTHLAELFIQRTQKLSPTLGEARTQRLTTQAYCLISEMEGQSEPGKGCQTSHWPWFR